MDERREHICLWGQEASVCALLPWCPAVAAQMGVSGCPPGLSPGYVGMLMHPQPHEQLLSGVGRCSEEHSTPGATRRPSPFHLSVAGS